MKQEKDNHFFATLQSDYAAWLSQILLSSIYDSIDSRKSVLSPPKLEFNAGGIDVPQRVIDSQGIIHEMGHKILGSKDKTSREEMETFLVTFENFQASLQQLENGVLFSDFAIDELTGLGTHDKMITELTKELERRARRGQPFCIVLSRIDGLEDKKSPQSILLASQAVKKTLRSFDDAYAIGDGEFLSSLKHSDNNGGLKFIGRLNSNLSNNVDVKFSMSSVVAEPYPGDNLETFVEAVKKDLSILSSSSKNVSGEYKEVSPLTQYIKSLKE